jgi:Bacterial TniB protein
MDRPADRLPTGMATRPTAATQKVWVVQTREGAGLSHFYASILSALQAPLGPVRDVVRKAEQLDRLLSELSPRVLIFDEFHNALRGRSRDVEAIFAFLAARSQLRYFAGAGRRGGGA